MTTVKVDLIDDSVLLLLKNLESMKLIRMQTPQPKTNPLTRYKGAWAKQPLPEVEEQLTELRQSWG